MRLSGIKDELTTLQACEIKLLHGLSTIRY